MICPEIGNANGNAYIGGHVNNVLRLSRALSDRGHEIKIITTPHRHPGTDTDKKIDWAEIISLPINEPYPSLRYGLHFMLKTLVEIKHIMNCKNIDIIHGHSGYSTMGLITGISGKIINIPTVHTIYSPIKPISSPNFIMIISNKFLSRFFLSLNNSIIAVSNNTFESLVSCGIESSKIGRIPPMVDTKIYNNPILQNTFRENLSLNKTDKIILYIGNLTRIKGIDVLLEAFKKVVCEFRDVKLLLVLNMPLAKYLNNENTDLYNAEHNFGIKEKIKKYGLSDYVIPIGLVNNLPDIMASSNLFVAPFLNTVGVLDYPLSLLEAMACGLPVIASSVGGIPEIIKNGENGLLVDPNDIDGLKNAIINLLVDYSNAKILGNEAKNFISSNFEIDVICSRYERIYCSLLK